MKRVCVIGAGTSGLAAIKSCMEEGFHVTCYEQSDYIGGLWRYRDEVEEDAGCVFACVVQNCFKEFMAYSDYPPPAKYPPYLRHSLYYEYLLSYVGHFNLKKFICFQHKVLEVVRTDDYDETGRWNVAVCDIQNNETRVECFDFVMVCSGHHTYPIMPAFPGEQDFKGRVMHSKEYKHPDAFRGANVVVVGFGNSAVDIATDLCSATKQTYLSARHKGWVFPRYLEGKRILEQVIYAKWIRSLYDLLPLSLLVSRYEGLANIGFDHKFCGLQPEHRIISQRPIVSDLLPLYLMNGSVKLKPGIKELRSNGVVFEGESEVTEADVLLCATGYKPVFPFLVGLENTDEYMENVYRLVFPAHLKHSTLVFIGLMDPNLSSPACSELQSRWVARIFSGKLKLPRREEMLDYARKFQNTLTTVCYKGFAQKTNVNGPSYLEEIARDLGVLPNLVKLAVTDPKLFYAVLFGPMCGYHYRIHGPHSWPGARKAILDIEDNLSVSSGHPTRSENGHANRRRNILVLGIFCTLGISLGYHYTSRGSCNLLPGLHVNFKFPSR